MLYNNLLKPLLFRLDAETAHDRITTLLQIAGHTPLAGRLLQALYGYAHPSLRVTVAGLAFSNPLGLAAGFDKRGTLIAPIGYLGFGHIEVGTVTPRPQSGNPRPRLFRLPEDAALINRLGFNSEGMVVLARRLRRSWVVGDGLWTDAPQSTSHHPQSKIVVGVNIGKNRDTPLERAVEDYAAAFVALAPLSDYVTVNISSPNTPGLRRLHEREALAALLAELSALNRRLRRPRPLFLKVSPDETAAQLDEVIEASLAAGVSGFIAGNTTLHRPGLRSAARDESGGLSGRPLATRARAVLAYLWRSTGGRVPLIGVGGIFSAEDAYQAIRAGASLIQLYTGMVYRGPGIARDITCGLVELLRRDGFAGVADAVGAG